MTQITRVPVGLQNFLGTQAQGKNPSELAQTVVPTIDLDQFLSIQQEEWIGAGFTPFTIQGFESFDVPENEVWLLRTLSWRHRSVGGNVGDKYTASQSLSNNSNSANPLTNHGIGDPYVYELTVDAGVIYTACELDNVIVPPGGRIVFHVSQVVSTAGSFHSEVFIRYLKLKV